MDEIPPEVPGYRLTRLLGTGSTSSVWRARRVVDDELVAIKLLPGGADEEAVREFSLLQHAVGEHVVTLHETLEVDGPEGPATALVLELLAGGSLAEVVAARGHLSPGETVTVIAPTAQALAGLHDLGVVHGDLSPGNVLLDSTGRPALADLGFARLTGEAPGDIHGTEGFVAPEVLDGSEPDRSSDVYALGAIAWLCLTGSPPEHITERIDLAAAVPDAPDLVAAVESALDTDPAARPEADELALAVFDSVTATALRMTSTGDVASGLTRRIRESATGGDREIPSWQRELERARPQGPRRRWWQRRVRPHPEPKGRPLAPAGRHAAPRRRQRGPGPAGTSLSGHPVTATRALARAAAEVPSGRRAALAVTAVLALLLAVLVPWQQLASAGGGDGARPGAGSPGAASTGSAGAAAEASSEASTGAAAVLADRAAPQEEPVALARELTSLRRAAVVDRDTRAVSRLAEAGSPEDHRVRGLIDLLRTRGERFHGVDLTVRSARLERSSASTVVLRTTTDEGRYAVVDAEGRREQHPARPRQEVDLVLVWDRERWRVRDVRTV